MTGRVVLRALLAVAFVALVAAGWAVANEQPARSRPAGGRRVLFDGFGGTRLNRRVWTPYTGRPGGDPGGWWEPSHVVVRNGVLNLETVEGVDEAPRRPSHAYDWVAVSARP